MVNKKTKLFNFLYIRAFQKMWLLRLVYLYYARRVLGGDVISSIVIEEKFEIFNSIYTIVINSGTIIKKNVIVIVNMADTPANVIRINTLFKNSIGGGITAIPFSKLTYVNVA